jgi:hypothetical protein
MIFKILSDIEVNLILCTASQPAFRSSSNVRVDDRVFAMCQFKSLPLDALMQSVYPDLYPLHNLTDEVSVPEKNHSFFYHKHLRLN